MKIITITYNYYDVMLATPEEDGKQRRLAYV